MMPRKSTSPRRKAKKSSRAARLARLSVDCESSECANAALILNTAHESAEALLKAYELARKERGKLRGMTTDEEQDLLRAMLVMSAAGLDAMAKQLIEDSLEQLLTKNEQAINTFEKFLARRFAADAQGTNRTGAKLIAFALVAESPRRQLISEYIRHLTSGSLQSVESLYEVLGALGVDPTTLQFEPTKIKTIFGIRNKIIHELDINLAARRRNRHLRSQAAMIRDTNYILSVAKGIVVAVDNIMIAG